MKFRICLKGGPGSGHRGHVGRPGKRGGSAPGAGGISGGTAPSLKDVASDTSWEGIGRVIDSHDEWPADVAERMAKLSGMDAKDVEQLHKFWILGAAEEFSGGVKGISAEELNNLRASAITEFGVPKGRTDPGVSKPQYQRLLRATYETTQQDLRDAGYGPNDSVLLFRGLRGKHGNVGDRIPYQGEALDSWTFEQYSASGFISGGGVILAMNVPISNILDVSVNGFGALDLDEVVTFGSIPGEAVIFK